MTRILVALLAVAVPCAAVGWSAPDVSASDRAPRFDPPKSYYLALGDSITYGFQLAKFLAGLAPSSYDTGYVDVLAARLRAIRPTTEVVNYGCPGESTSTFIAGPCLYTAIGEELHDGFDGSQLDAATSFLRAHPGQVGPITLHLSGNDVNELVRSCGGDVDCIRRAAPAAIAALAGRFGVILGRLREAAPYAEIIVIGGWRVGPPDEFDGLFEAGNAAVAAVAARERAYFADLLPVFNPPGEAARLTALCTLTLVCSEGDGHPSDAGYRAIADAVFDASEYARLGD